MRPMILQAVAAMAQLTARMGKASYQPEPLTIEMYCQHVSTCMQVAASLLYAAKN